MFFFHPEKNFEIFSRISYILMVKYVSQRVGMILFFEMGETKHILGTTFAKNFITQKWWAWLSFRTGHDPLPI